MSIGEMIMRLRGVANPSEAILAQALAGGSAYGQDSTQGGAGAEAATDVAGDQPQPEAYTSPPDLSKMYKELTDYDRKTRAFDRGASLIASSFASPQGKQAILSSMNDGPSYGSPMEMLKTVSSLRENQAAMESKAKIAGSLPNIAKAYGIDLSVVQYLHSTGSLDTLLNKKEEPNFQNVEGYDGTDYLINTNASPDSPNFKTTISGSDPTTGQKIVDGPSGGKMLVDAEGNVLKVIAAPMTSDLVELDAINQERQSNGQLPISKEDWIKTQTTNKAPKTSVNLGNNKLEEEFAKTYSEDYGTAKSAKATISALAPAMNALEGGIISGAPYSELELSARKTLGGVFGIDDEKIVNTELFGTAMKEIVLPKVKSLGTGNSISNADRDFVEKSVGANLTLDPKSAKQILARTERLAREQLIQYNKEMAALINKNKEQGITLNNVRLLEVPAPSSSLLELIPDAAVQELLEDPSAAAEFNDHFGSGLAEYFIGESNGQ